MADGMWTTGSFHCVYGVVLLGFIIVLGCSSGNASDPCTKLMFSTTINGRPCQNCSLCNSKQPTFERLKNDVCIEKNPDPIYTGGYLWCQNPMGPYPKCPDLKSLVHVLNCSHGPNNTNPGVNCMIKCGFEKINITCSENITWVPDPKTCPPLPTMQTSVIPESTTATMVTSERFKGGDSDIIVTVAESTTATMVTSESFKGGDSDIIIAVAVTVAVVAVLCCLTFMGLYLLQKRCSRMCNPQSRSSSQSSGSNTASITESAEGPGEERRSLLLANESGPMEGAFPGRVVCGVSPAEYRKEVPVKADADHPTQTEQMQQRSTMVHFNGHLHINGFANKTEYGGTCDDSSLDDFQPAAKSAVIGAGKSVPKESDGKQMRTTDIEAQVWQQVHPGNMQEVTISPQPFEGGDNYCALVAFLNDRETALKFCDFFDQRDGFDSVTWHNIAACLLQKTTDEIKAFEYRSIPTLGDQLSSKPTYRILDEAKQRGLGLLDLKSFLESELKTKPDAPSARKGIALLNTFWSAWLAQKQSTAVPNTRV